MPFGHEDTQQISRAPSIPEGIFDAQFPCPHRKGAVDFLGSLAGLDGFEYLELPVRPSERVVLSVLAACEGPESRSACSAMSTTFRSLAATARRGPTSANPSSSGVRLRRGRLAQAHGRVRARDRQAEPRPWVDGLK